MSATAETVATAKKVEKKPKTAEKLPAVPESKLKLAKRKLAAKPGSIAARRLLRAKLALRRRQNLRRAEKYSKKYLRYNQKIVEAARTAKKAGNIYIPAEPTVAFVVRIRG